jgi:hypothetical protein
VFLKNPFKKLFWGANMITQITLACILIAFVISSGEIFLEYFYNILEKVFEKSFKVLKFYSYYLIMVHVENLAKNVIFKKIEIHLQVFLLLKKNGTLFIECLC